MDDRYSGDKQQRAPEGDRGREGFGDDGGTRVGRPDPAQAADKHTGPSSQPAQEGLEGSIFEGDEDAHGRGRTQNDSGPASSRDSQRYGGKSTGAGAEGDKDAKRGSS